MTDDDFIEYTLPGETLSDEQRRFFLNSFTPEKRATIERMQELEGEIALWQANLGPMPSGVILCGPRQIRGAR